MTGPHERNYTSFWNHTSNRMRARGRIDANPKIVCTPWDAH